MKVVLLEDVKNLGKADDVVEVKSGYANNFLFKKGLAVPANSDKLHELKQKAGARKAQEKRELEEAQAMGEKLDGQTFTVKKKAGDKGRLYGTLTSMDVEEVLAQEGYKVNKRNINLDTELKNVGSTGAELKLHNDVKVKITVQVEAL
jgi:large subunit ribosomal protein L9